MAIFSDDQLEAFCILATNGKLSPAELSRKLGKKLPNVLTEIINPSIEQGVLRKEKSKSTGKPGRPPNLCYLDEKHYPTILSNAKRLGKEFSGNLEKVYKKYGSRELISTEEEARAHWEKERENKELQSHLREVHDKRNLYFRTEIIFGNKLTELGVRLQWEQREEILKSGNKLVPFKNWSPALAEVLRSAKYIEPYCRSPGMALQVVFELMPDLYNQHFDWELYDPSFSPKKGWSQSNAIELWFLLGENYFGLFKKPKIELENVEKNKDKIINRILVCPFLNKAKEMNLETNFESCEEYCRVNVDSLNPKYTHRFTKAMCKGDPYCESIIELKPP
jgi:hypothetical protein